METPEFLSPSLRRRAVDQPDQGRDRYYEDLPPAVPIGCPPPDKIKAHLLSFITLKKWFSRYHKDLLPKDVLAGGELRSLVTTPTCSPHPHVYTSPLCIVTVGVLAVPQCMSFATVAGLPPLYGLYTALMALVLYPFLGSSPHLLNGPTAVMSLLASAAVPYSPLFSDLATGYFSFCARHLLPLSPLI